jgi:dCMP deaminase
MLDAKTTYDEWDRYFITMAYLVSMKSKDPSTKVGAIIAGPDKEIRATGYNGFPRGVLDLPERYENKEYKYLAINHAEENAILHCARIGVSAFGCIIYTPWFPCSYCTKAIIQSGISKVVYHKEFPGNKNNEKWSKSIDIAKSMLKEASIEIRCFSGMILEINPIYNGEIFKI